jgi:PAS domain S-box-containing protein
MTAASQVDLEPLLRAILDTALDAVILIDSDGVIRFWNQQAEAVFGWTAAEALGQRLSALIVPERYRDGHDRGLAGFVGTGSGPMTNRRTEMVARRNDGCEVPVELTIVPVSSGATWMFSAFVRDLSERQRVTAALEESQRQLRSLADRLRKVREEERASIARQIHDEMGQVLTALRLDVAWLEARLPKEQQSLLDKCGTMAKLIETTIGRVRSLATELRPALLDDLGLPAAIEWETKEFARRSGLRCHLHLPADLTGLDSERATDLFRILQEALTNVARHAVARRVEVRLRVEGGDVVLQVADDGRGITPAEVADPRSLGLLGMRERALLWNGAVEVAAGSAGGTCLTVRLPLSRNGRPS